MEDEVEEVDGEDTTDAKADGGVRINNIYRSATIYGKDWHINVAISACDEDALERAVAMARLFFDSQEAAPDIRVEWRTEGAT